MASANNTAILPEATRKSNAGPVPGARYVCERCANCCRWPGYVRFRRVWSLIRSWRTPDRSAALRLIVLTAVLLASVSPALTEMPVTGARTGAKARWLRQWLGVEGKASVSYDDIRIPSKALQDRDMVKSAVPVPLHLLSEPAKAASADEEGEPFDSYLQGIALKLSREGRKDAEGLWRDFRMFMNTMPECCADILKGHLEITPPNGRPQPEGISGDQPVGLLVKEHSRVEIRDRIHWALPPEPGINVRGYDMARPGDRWQGQFTDRETSRDYKFRAVIPALSPSTPSLGLEADGRWRRSTADFVWDGEAEDSAGELLREGGCGTRWYHGLNGSYVSMGFRQSTIDFDDLNNDSVDWSAYGGNYRQFYVTVDWHFNPLDYDPDVLFAPGSGAAVTFISALESLGSPVSFEEVQGAFEQTHGVFHRLFLDIRISGAAVEGLPRVLLPELGGGDTVRGHSPQLSADRLVSVQQSLRHHFFWRHGVVFIPYVFGDVGWASQVSLEQERRDDWLCGTGVGVRWEFGEMYGFKLLEFTLARGLGDNGEFQVDVRTRFDF